jgi:hypothetical protein
VASAEWPTASFTLELVQAVFDSGHASKLAKGIRDDFLNSFQGVGNIVRENRGWDDTLCETAGPFFDWS